jgi:hypothetical protein
MALLFTAQSRVTGVALGEFFSKYCVTQLIRMLVIRISDYSSLLGPSGNFVGNSTKLTCLEIAGYKIKYSTVLWLTELQIKCGRKV